ncbi:MAG: aminomethyl-transferring glycine dehydrogenase subunit GcvPA [Dehalococcoidia bacterium]|nr:aminomethyl-transferring glycine dehydrogenase subunit GcvPA [Dehalococcoidia bacterium]
MRFIPSTDEQKKEMLREIGVESFESLIESVPQQVRLDRELSIPDALAEHDLEQHIYAVSKQNCDFAQMKSLLGAGAYRHHVPAPVRTLLAREEFWTSYTPYQPEMSQGTLQSMFEAQTYFARLSGMEVAISSMYDGATAAAEAALMAIRITHKERIVLAGAIHPLYKRTIRTYLAPHGIDVMDAPHAAGMVDSQALEGITDKNVAAVVVQSPNFFGGIENLDRISDAAHSTEALFIVAVAEGLSLGLLKGPGESDADLVACDTNSFGLSLNFGGPHNAFLACKRKYMRQLAGRIVGETQDVDGKRVFVMTLRAREQDIRREKATSNICSNHGLNVTAANIYLSLLGTEGLHELALLNSRAAHYLEKALLATGRFERVMGCPFFNEFMLRAKDGASVVMETLLADGFVPPLDVGAFLRDDAYQGALLFATTELLNRGDLDRVAEVLS